QLWKTHIKLLASSIRRAVPRPNVSVSIASEISKISTLNPLLLMMLNVELREEKKLNRSTKEASLWRSYRRKATRAQSEAALVEQYLPLVKTVVGRLQMSLPSHVDAEDLYSAGLVGLLDAIRHYNP